jgi:tRNA1(Val) A37 N6-methylase TrmN6
MFKTGKMMEKHLEIKSKLMNTSYDIFQLKDHAYNLDSILLADFIKITKDMKEIHDFGTGQGVLLLYMSLKTTIPLYGYEILKPLYDIAVKNVIHNALESRIQIIHQDIKTLSLKHVDCIISNPPYFKMTEDIKVAKNETRSLARHEINLELEELLKIVSQSLKYQGTFYLIHRADRFEEIISLASKVLLKPKIIQFVHPYMDSEANQVLIKFTKQGGSGLKIYPPIILYDEKHVMTKKLISIYEGE